jgi:thiol-disulfide isomerase/thioredoxin
MKGKSWLSFFRLILILIIVLCSSTSGLFAETPAVGIQLPLFTLPAPDSPQTQAYLGLKTMEPFTLSAIKAKMVLIEFLSATCTHCIASAPVVNRLYKVIQDDPALARDVKMIGVAMGNDKSLANAFKKTTKIPFPVFPDEKLDIAAAIDINETPTMLLVSSSGKTLACHKGAFKDLDGFLKELREIHKTQ